MGNIIFQFCPMCGDLFDCYCNTDYQCWCTKVKIDAEVLEKISQEFSGCLCPDCLSKLAEDSEISNKKEIKS